MNSIKQEQYIASLILKEKTLGLNDSEKYELTLWRQADSRNESIYIRLQERDFSSDISNYENIDVQKGFKRYRARFITKRRRVFPLYWAAAILVICFSTLFLYRMEQDKTGHVQGIEPGCSKATLVLGDGQMINLKDKKQSQISTLEGISIRNNGVELDYSGSESKEYGNVINYNDLIVPKGGEYQITLGDGTKVWLNAQSKLRFPVVFRDSTRDVFLEGEAYFEVMKDSLHPFRVLVKDDVSVEVLGTAFNVRAYVDDVNVETILEKGSVRVKRGEQSVVLHPGQKATCSGDRIYTEEVSTELYTAWREGQYVFVDESVENILKRLSRWYDVEICYTQEAAKFMTFSGDVRKYNNINTLLEAMEIAGGIRFQINNRVIIVSCK